MEKMLMIRCDEDSYRVEEVKAVNKYLEEGWKVEMISSAAARGVESCHAHSWAFVVLEKDEE